MLLLPPALSVIAFRNRWEAFFREQMTIFKDRYQTGVYDSEQYQDAKTALFALDDQHRCCCCHAAN